MPTLPLPDTERCDRFWNRQPSDRPLLAAWVGVFDVSTLYSAGLARLPEGRLQPGDIDFELFRPDYERLFAEHSQLSVDAPWAAFPLMVIPWVEAILGCPVHHRGGNVWAGRWLDSYERLAGGLTLDADWLDSLLNFQRWLVELAAGRFPVALSLMRGPTDLLAALRDAQKSVYDLYDHPEPVSQALHLLSGAWMQIAAAQSEVVPPFADGYSFSVQNLWSRQRGGWFQDDALAYWSPGFYRQHALSCQQRLAAALPATGIHLHSPALYIVDGLLDMPDLDVIEVNLDDVGLRIPDMIPHFQRILAKKCLYIWGAFATDDLKLMRDHLPTAGLALQLMAETPEAVQAMIREVETLWR